MVRYLITLIYLYGLTFSLNAQSVDLVVQSKAVSDLFGTSIIDHLGIKDAILLERQARQPDVAQVVKTYVKSEKIDNVILIGQFYDVGETKHIPVFTQFKIPNDFFTEPVYVLQGASKLEEERRNVIDKQVKITRTFSVETEYDLRKAMTELRNLPKGFVFINVFSLKDNWGEKRSYKTIEEIVVNSNVRHVDVGICYDGYRTALAVGPTPEDTEVIAKGENSTSICASLSRLVSLGRTDLYKQKTGSFYYVSP